MRAPCPFGTHRVLEPAGCLPQAALRVDNTPTCHDNELLIEVDRLNVDSASMRQLATEQGGDPAGVAARIAEIVAARGKLHNPVTGSGGMLLGRISRVGSRFPSAPAAGERIATLVSLTLTPLFLRRILAIDLATDQASVEGTAILFETGLWARVPADLPEHVALAAFDVCGAPAKTEELVGPGSTVLVLGGGGRSGLLCSAMARERGAARVVAVDNEPRALERARRAAAAHEVLAADARNPVGLLERLGERVDLTLSCVNVPGVEASAIVATKPTGLVYFFSMATSFTAAALGAEGVGSPVTMMIGNGYTPGHAETCLRLLRRSPRLYDAFSETCAFSPA